MPERTSYPPGTPSWTDLSTTDPAAAREFYGAVLGWEFAEFPTDQGDPYIMAMKGGQPVAGLMKSQMEGMPSMWSTYINVDDCDDATARAKDAGGQIIIDAMDVMDSGRMSFVADPTGAAIGMWQKGNHFGAGVVNEPGAFTWSELYSTDTEAATTFYGEVFGLGTHVMDMGENGPYTTFTVGERVVGGTMKPPMAEIPNHWHVYFGAADTDATCKAVEAAGGKVKMAPMDTPVGRMATIEDPTGAVFSVIQLNEWPDA